MQGAEILYLVLSVAFVVPIWIMWRTRIVSLHARIEVPPEPASSEPAAHPTPLGSLPPADWSVSDPNVNAPLQPLRAASLMPKRAPSQRPVTLSDGTPALVPSLRPSESLPMPLRGSAILPSIRPRSVNDARRDGLPVPVRSVPPTERNKT